jgi:hypothetical protein
VAGEKTVLMHILGVRDNGSLGGKRLQFHLFDVAAVDFGGDGAATSDSLGSGPKVLDGGDRDPVTAGHGDVQVSAQISIIPSTKAARR